MRKNILLLSILTTFSCKKDVCTVPSACTDLPNQTGVCLAYFESWFYNESTNQCEKIGYSGCNANGFETKEECELCACNN
ncbi:MAG: BPTI/Kunitz domain-containing protein [Lishizhenia sp.]